MFTFEIFSAWLIVFLTLSIFSYLYDDNPFYKAAEHLYVGVSAGYVAVISFWQQIQPNMFGRLWPKVEKLCKEHNILLAMDEVQTGFGRTGENFAHQLFNVKPDIIGCGKAAGGGILPVSFVAGKKEVIDTLTPGSEGSTFGGYPLAAVVGGYAVVKRI